MSDDLGRRLEGRAQELADTAVSKGRVVVVILAEWGTDGMLVYGATMRGISDPKFADKLLGHVAEELSYAKLVVMS